MLELGHGSMEKTEKTQRDKESKGKDSPKDKGNKGKDKEKEPKEKEEKKSRSVSRTLSRVLSGREPPKEKEEKEKEKEKSASPRATVQPPPMSNAGAAPGVVRSSSRPVPGPLTPSRAVLCSCNVLCSDVLLGCCRCCLLFAPLTACSPHLAS